MNTSNPAKTAAIIGACVLLGIAGLYLLALRTQPPASPAATSSPAPVPVPKRTTGSASPLPGLPSPAADSSRPAVTRPTADSLADQLNAVLREPEGSKRRAQLRALLAGLELADLEWANGIIRGLGPLQTQPLPYPRGGDCRSCHTSGTPKGDFNQCAVNPRLNEPMQALLFRWGQLDPQAALAQAGQLSDARLAWFAQVNALEGWIAADPAAATQHVWQNNKQLSAGQNTLVKAFNQWGQIDPAATVAFLEKIPVGEQLPYATALAGGWAQTDPAAAVNWATTLADPRVRTTTYQAIAYVWTGANPEAAGQWLNSLPAGRDRDLVASIYSRSLAGALSGADNSRPPDPQAATQWAASIADVGIRSGAYRTIAAAWARTDRAAATTWANQLPAGPDRDAALAAVNAN